MLLVAQAAYELVVLTAVVSSVVVVTLVVVEVDTVVLNTVVVNVLVDVALGGTTVLVDVTVV